jgi:hypothetical protein
MSRFARRAGRRRSGWIGPLLLILLGGLLWLNNSGAFSLTPRLGGWLVLLPAAALLLSVVPAAVAGRWRGAMGRAFAGLLLAGVSGMLLANIDLGVYLPLLLVASGGLLLIPGLLAREAA